MRFINQTTGNLSNMISISNSAKTNCDNSSEISDSIESIHDSNNNNNNNNNNSTMSDNFNNWTINSRHDVAIAAGLMKLNKKAFTVLCDPLESENQEGNREEFPDFRQAPTSRQPVSIWLLNCRYDCIPRVAKMLGYKIVRPTNILMPNKASIVEFNYELRLSHKRNQEQDMWNLCWTDSLVAVDFCRDMRRFQKINHFPGMFEICRKDLLARNLNRMLKLFPNDYNIFPKSWCFPADLGDAIQYSRQYKSKTFIIKPDQGSQGKGIYLTKNLKEVKINERMICQVYLNKPLLIDGYKFDLRVYCLITSLDPLRIFVYNEGLARFATTKYREPSDYNSGNMFMHLTNYSVNKHSRMYSTDDEVGTKRKISTLNRILAHEGFDVAELWANIDDVIIKTILSALPMLKHNYNASFPSHDMVQACFELLGMDILIDSKMRPFILEVNHSPSFHTSEQVDKEVKENLIRDTFVILNLTQDIRKKVLEEDRRRIRDRLLQRIKDSKETSSNNSGGNSNNNNVANKEEEDDSQTEIYLDKLHNWEQQIAWEDTHLGGYRRIMPCPNDINRYQKFYVQQNQLSVYSETAASKRREECAKQQRIELEEKFKHNQAILKHFRLSKNIGEGDDFIRKKKSKKNKRNFFKPDEIVEHDERERLASMAQREYLVKSVGLLQNIYVNFHKSSLLTDSDRRKYKDLFAKVVVNEMTTSLPVLGTNSTVQSKPKVNKGAATISMPTNLNTLIENENENSTNSSSNSNGIQLESATTTTNANNWMSCSEVPVTFRPQLPCLAVKNNISNNTSTNKAHLARQVTNVIKRHNIEARQQLLTDKVI
ncbi:hypothetical protein PVAND_009623 [Polypedilum vanderplanki]|uniref:Uncharacterized protein n=1 Tax=Polypedilum vanderplanki TaxID=319348 RepID=A0A9J6CD41_POLVA|nr:hypothetical protein PVAND_009623 [Polypedilum vanderplanki]